MKAACCTTKPSRAPEVKRWPPSGKSVRQLPFKAALGIQTGDLVTAVYPSGFTSVQYIVVSVSAPHYVSRYPFALVVRHWPVVCLEMARNPEDLGSRETRSYMNDIRRDDDGTWWTDMGDQVLVERPGRHVIPFQRSLTGGPLHTGSPYDFQPGVQYPVYPDGRRMSPVSAWKCEPCGKDFNAHHLARNYPAYCRCGRVGTHIVVMPPRVRGVVQEGSYVMSL